MTVDVRELLDSLSLNEFNGSNLLVDQILSSWKPGVDVRVDAKVVVWVASRLDQDKILEISRTIPIATLLLGCYDECVNVLRPFFEDSKKTALSSSSLIREQLTPSQVCPSDQLAVWDNESSWKTSDSIKNAPLWIVSHLDTDSIDKYERASKFIPFILLVAEDYEPSIRLHGVRIIREYLRCVSDRILSQMQLYHLFRKTLMTNLSFDDVDLKRESLELLTGRLIMPIKSIPQEIQLEWAESLLSVLMREVLFCKEDVVRSILLSFIPALIRGLGLASVCYIKNVLALLMDLPLQDRGNDIVFDILSALFDCTWPRLGRHGLIVNQVLSQIGDGEDQSRVLQFKNRMALLAPSVTINTIR